MYNYVCACAVYMCKCRCQYRSAGAEWRPWWFISSWRRKVLTRPVPHQAHRTHQVSHLLVLLLFFLFHYLTFSLLSRVFTTVVTALGNNFSPSRCSEITPGFVKDVSKYDSCAMYIYIWVYMYMYMHWTKIYVVMTDVLYWLISYFSVCLSSPLSQTECLSHHQLHPCVQWCHLLWGTHHGGQPMHYWTEQVSPGTLCQLLRHCC